MSKAVLCALIASAGLATSAAADVVTQWNFNSNPSDANTGTGVTTPSTGAGTLVTISGVTSTFASGAANGGSTDTNVGDNSGFQTTAYPATAVGNETAGLEVLASTAGFQDITITWDQRHSNTSSRFWSFYFTLDGSTWNRLFLDVSNASAGLNAAGVFGTNGTLGGPLGDTWFNGRSVSLAAIPGASDNANFGFRIVSSFDGGTGYTASSSTATYAGSGTSRFDMVTISGTAVPTPGAFALMGIGGLVALRRNR